MSDNIHEGGSQDPVEAQRALLRGALMSLAHPLQASVDRVVQTADVPGSGFASEDDVSKAALPRAGRLLVWPLRGPRHQEAEVGAAVQSPYRVCNLPAYEREGLRFERSIRFTRDDEDIRVPHELRLKVIDARNRSTGRQQIVPDVLPFLTLSMTYHPEQGPEITVSWDRSRHSELLEFADMTGNHMLARWAAAMQREIDLVASHHRASMRLKGNFMSDMREGASIAIRPAQLEVDATVTTTFRDHEYYCAPGDPSYEKYHKWHTTTGGVELAYDPSGCTFTSAPGTAHGFKEGRDGQWAIPEANTLILASQLLNTFGQQLWTQP